MTYITLDKVSQRPEVLNPCVIYLVNGMAENQMSRLGEGIILSLFGNIQEEIQIINLIKKVSKKFAIEK